MEPDQLAPPQAGISIAGSRGLRYATLCALYFAQGVPWGFVTIALVAVLSEAGVDQVQTGLLVSVSILPWTFKIIWGPVIDSFRLPALGLRRPWIVLAEAMMAVTLLAAGSVGDPSRPDALSWLIWVFFVHNCFASLQDVATDAMAVDLLEESERGKVNGYMWASKLVGISVGGAGLATVIANWGLAAGMRVQAMVILSIMLLPLLIRERSGEKLLPWSKGRSMAPARAAAARSPLSVFRELVRAYSLPTTRIAAAVSVTAFIGEGFYTPLTPEVYTQVLGWTAEEYGHVQGIWGTAGKLLGALIGGYLCDRIGRRKMASIGVMITGSTFLLFAATSGFWDASWYPLQLFPMFVEWGLATTSVSLFALFMKISWTAAAATQFTMFMTINNMGFALGPYLTRLGLGYTGSYVLCGAVSLLPLLFLPLLDPDSVVRRRLAELAEDEPSAQIGAPVPSGGTMG